MLVFHDNDELTNKPNDEQMMNQMMNQTKWWTNDEPNDDPRNAKHKSIWGTGVCWRQLTTNVYLISNKIKPWRALMFVCAPNPNPTIYTIVCRLLIYAYRHPLLRFSFRL